MDNKTSGWFTGDQQANIKRITANSDIASTDRRATTNQPDNRTAPSSAERVEESEQEANEESHQKVSMEHPSHGGDESLKALLQTTQQLFRADSEDEVAKIVVTAASDIVGVPLNGLFRYNETTEELEPVEASEKATAVLEEIPTFAPGNSVAWQVFESGEPAVYDDVTAAEAVYNPSTPIQTEIAVPVGEYGIFLAGSTEPAAFDDRCVSLATLLAETADAALAQLANQQALEAATTRLATQNTRLEKFTSILSHDLRNPLAVARSGVTVARETGDDEPLQRVDRAHDRMETLIDDLLTLARSGETITDAEMEPISLETICTQSWATVLNSSGELVCEDTTTLIAHESRLQQLLENLFRNSVDHADEDVTVRVGSLADGFYVEDDGPGIPERKREDVFDSGYSTKEKGTGLGLEIVNSIVATHDWSITITESESGGARFEITGVETRTE